MVVRLAIGLLKLLINTIEAIPEGGRRREVGFRAGPNLFVYAGGLALRSPSVLYRAVRVLRTSLLDGRIDNHSPIPLAGPGLLQALGRHEVTLPPLGSFRPGSLGPVDLLNIASIARAVDARKIFEIGTFNGVTALTLAINCPTATVYTLDLEPGVAPSMPTERIDADLIAEAPSRVYQDHPASDRVVQLLGDSATFDFTQFHGCCDLVFIDGAHSAEYVSSDTETAFRLITERSAVVWDDYWRMAPAVVEYLDSRADLRLHRLAGTRLVAWFSDTARQHLGLD